MTNAWKIGTFALVALVAVVALGLNGRAKSNNLPSDDAEMYPQFCSVVDPITHAKRITFLGFDVGDWLILIIGIALVGLLLVLA